MTITIVNYSITIIIEALQKKRKNNRLYSHLINAIHRRDMIHDSRLSSSMKRYSYRYFPLFRFTILFSHGNAVDLGQMTSFFIGLGKRINCNIFSYDYSGYGASTGKPSEKNLYADIDTAWQSLRTRYGISPENIILYGQSIGTVPTVDLASR